MKKIICILLCAVMLLVSCGTYDRDTLNSPEPSDTDALDASSAESQNENTESQGVSTQPAESGGEYEDPPVEPQDRELIESPEPERYYSGYEYCLSLPEDDFTDFWYSGIIVTVELIEVLPDTYVSFYDWDKSEVRLLEVRTVNNLGSGSVAESFYFLIPNDYFTDFTQYKTFVLPRAIQFSMENSVWYNKTLGCAERLDLPVYGGSEYFDLLSYSSIKAFNEAGFLDIGLWYSTDAWLETTDGGMKYYEEKHNGKYIKMIEGTYSLAEAEDEVRNLRNTVSTVTLDRYSGEPLAALEYVMNTENGIFVDGSRMSSLKCRYINGYPTNEWVKVYSDSPVYSEIKFTDKDIEKLPDLAPALKEIGESFEAGEIKPPHIRFSLHNSYHAHALTGSYYKIGNEVYGIIRLTWRYSFYRLENDGYLHTGDLKAIDNDLIDHRYYVVRSGADACEEIGIDEFCALMNSEEPAEYDGYGLVYPARDA